MNFVLDSPLRVTPAMTSGAADQRLTIADIEALVEAAEPRAGKRRSYKKREAA
jgi:hypothetical protein